MALPKQLSQRERDKFISPSSGNPVAIAVANPDGTVISSSATVAIGSAATIFAVVNTAATAQASVVLDTGVNYIGLATVINANQPALIASTAYIGLASVNVGGSLPAGSNFIGLVSTASIKGDINLATLISGEDQTNDLLKVGGNIAHASADVGNPVKIGGIAIPQEVTASTASGNRVNAWFDNQGRLGIFGNVTITPISNVTLNASNAFIGLISVASIHGKVAINDGTNSAVINNPNDATSHLNALFTTTFPFIYNGSTWDRIRTVNAANATTGIGTLGTGFLGFDGTNYRRVLIDTSGVLHANVSLSASSNFIGLVSTASIQGKVELQTGTNYIGLASVNIGGTLPALVASSAFIGLVSTASIKGDVNLATLISGEDQTNDVMKVENQFSTATLASNTTVLVKGAAGLLHCINVGMPSSPTITIYDNTVPSGLIIQKWGANYPLGSHLFDAKFTVGLSIDGAAAGVAPQLSISYR